MPPKLLFLHGAGTNAAIFRIQSRNLAALLKTHFELVYLDGFLPSPPGPGVLPFFEGAGPYLKWLCDEPVRDEALHWQCADGVDRLVAEYRRLGPFVGVVGFSQGAKAGMYLVRRLEELNEAGELRIFVAVCGTSPFEGGREVDGQEEENGIRKEGFRESLEKGLVKTESVHVIGDNDPWRVPSETLVGFFEGPKRVVRFKGAHHMPVEEEVNKLVVDLILAAYADM
jgi:pimeloyl-ACP methyl ester carboxylesterase